MANTTYRELADLVFSKIKDTDLGALPDDAAYGIVVGYMRPAIVRFENCKQDLSDRDDALGEFNFRLTDDTAVILANYMVVEWLDSNFILTTATLKSRLSSADFHALNLHQQLGKATELREALLRESRQLEIDKSYRGSPLFDAARGGRPRRGGRKGAPG